MTEEKLRELYSQYYRLVMKAAYEVLHDFDYSQDICQEVFTKLAVKFDEVRPEQYSQWLATVARRKALAFLHNDKDVVSKVFNELAPKYKDRNGGYTRIIKLKERVGDDALTVKLELV